MHDHEDLVRRGLARWYRGRLIPIMKGGDETDDAPADDAAGDDALSFPAIQESLDALSDEEIASFVEETQAVAREILAAPDEFVTEDTTSAELHALVTAHLSAARQAKETLAARAPQPPLDFDGLAAELAELSAADDDGGDDDGDGDGDGGDDAGDGEAAAADSVTASSGPPAKPENRRCRGSGRTDAPPETQQAPMVAMTAAAPNLGFDVGEELPGPVELARMMEARRSQFGTIPSGTKGEKIPIARANWSDQYPSERTLDGDLLRNHELIAAATDPDMILANMEARKKGSLTASGGLCAPVTPYYNLMMVSVAERPVRAALAAFNADRGGIRYARPATLASITTAVGVKTAAQDAAGGTEAQKTCQVVDCPPFVETDVQILFHCLQFGNLGARTFPERVAQWNNLTLAAHARLAESELLTGIDAFSTQVTASSLGLGASATLPSQILAAAEGMRSRHRMDPNAVLRVILPKWVLSLLVSDVYRSQFDRFSMGPDDFIRILRAANVEPTFHIDGANGRGQVFNTQGATTLVPFPADVVWYLYPEGSFLFVDGGTLELGLVRDSVLNKTNDFQIFGESFENVAFVGVESLAVQSAVCDTGYTHGSIAKAEASETACPYAYS